MWIPLKTILSQIVFSHDNMNLSIINLVYSNERLLNSIKDNLKIKKDTVYFFQDKLFLDSNYYFSHSKEESENGWDIYNQTGQIVWKDLKLEDNQKILYNKNRLYLIDYNSSKIPVAIEYYNIDSHSKNKIKLRNITFVGMDKENIYFINFYRKSKIGLLKKSLAPKDIFTIDLNGYRIVEKHKIFPERHYKFYSNVFKLYYVNECDIKKDEKDPFNYLGLREFKNPKSFIIEYYENVDTFESFNTIPNHIKCTFNNNFLLFNHLNNEFIIVDKDSITNVQLCSIIDQKEFINLFIDSTIYDNYFSDLYMNTYVNTFVQNLIDLNIYNDYLLLVLSYPSFNSKSNRNDFSFLFIRYNITDSKLDIIPIKRLD